MNSADARDVKSDPGDREDSARIQIEVETARQGEEASVKIEVEEEDNPIIRIEVEKDQLRRVSAESIEDEVELEDAVTEQVRLFRKWVD